MQHPVTLFVHLPKTAGTTMRQILYSQHPKENAILHVHRIPPAELAAKLENLPPEVQVITGHFDFDVRQHLRQPHRVFTLLRDPVERLLSLYFYIGREKAHRWHQRFLSGELTLLQCAREEQNLQTRLLAGRNGTEGLSGRELLERAKHNLANECAAFGLTERFDESIILFNRTLGWNVRGYTSDNVTRKRPTSSSTSKEDLEEIRRCNELDLELYEFARQLFEERVQAQPASFHRELSRLRQSVRFYQGLASCARILKSLVSLPKRETPHTP